MSVDIEGIIINILTGDLGMRRTQASMTSFLLELGVQSQRFVKRYKDNIYI